jgi:predicted nuclease of predicted toxin-antitoxin system
MRVLLDQGTPFRCAAILREASWDAVHTGEIGLASADDETILAHAAKDSRTVITLDADFQQMLAFKRASLPSVVRVRIEGLTSIPFANMIVRELMPRAKLLESGVLISISQRGVRVRSLPIIPPSRTQ